MVGSARARRTRSSAPWLVSALLLATPAASQVTPNGDQFQVNTFTTGVQFHPALATDASGRVVAVWESDSSPGTDSDGRSIQARRYAASGSPLGDQFQVNSYTTGWQSFPWVAADATGNFVVVWQSDGSAGSDTAATSVQARRFAANGTPLGDQFQVNSYTTSWQGEPRVAVAAAGAFVVVWTSDGSPGSDVSSFSIQARRYAAGGTPLGAQFQVNSYTTGYQMEPAVANDDAGGFVVAWTSDGSPGSDSSGYGIQAQRYDASGALAGGQFQVNTFTTSSQEEPAVAVAPTGSFVVAWTSTGSAGSDSAATSVQAQRFAANGTPAGGQFKVNTYTPNDQGTPALSTDAAGNFVVAWQSNGSAGSDTDWFSIHARRYAAGGTPASVEFQVNSYTTSGQWPAAVTADPRGNFVIAWSSFGSFGSDADQSSVQARRYDGLFRDGFGSGSTVRWSSVLP